MLATELDAKRLQLLHEAVPGVSRIAALAVSPDQHAANLAAMRQAASHEGLALLTFYAAQPEDYPATFAAMRDADASALQIVSAPQFLTNASTLAELALKARLPDDVRVAIDGRPGLLAGLWAGLRRTATSRGRLCCPDLSWSLAW